MDNCEKTECGGVNKMDDDVAKIEWKMLKDAKLNNTDELTSRSIMLVFIFE